MSSDIEVDGIWDDHDYGVNDAGRWITDQDHRQQIFSDFIRFHSSSPDYSQAEARNTLYHDVDFEISGILVKFIFLDTRSYRDSHWIRSVGND